MASFITNLAEFDDEKIQFGRTGRIKGQQMRKRRIQYQIQDEQLLDTIEHWESLESNMDLLNFLDAISFCLRKYCTKLSAPPMSKKKLSAKEREHLSQTWVEFKGE